MSVDTSDSVAKPESVAKELALTDKYPNLKFMLQRVAQEASWAGDAAQQNQAIQMDILERMLSAETEEELFALQEAGGISGKDYVNTPFRIGAGDITFKESKIVGSGLPFYAMLNVVEEASGNAVTVTTGAVNVIGVLHTLLVWNDDDRPAEKRSFAPWDDFGGRLFQFVEKQTASGNSVLMMKPLEMKPPTPRVAKSSAKK